MSSSNISDLAIALAESSGKKVAYLQNRIRGGHAPTNKDLELLLVAAREAKTAISLGNASSAIKKRR